MKVLIVTGLLLAFLPATATPAPETQLHQLTETGISRSRTEQKVQQQVDQLHSDQQSLEADYRHLLKVTDGIRSYNQVLEQQINQQQRDISQLQQGIKDAAQMERQIIPLLRRMVSSLEAFVELDMPFLVTERRFRVQELQQLITRADISTAEKMRRVLQACQIENDYGRTLEAYRDQIDINGELIAADFLRVGRVALMYQTLDGQHTGVWHQQTAAWIPRNDHRFRQSLRQGLKMARKQVAPELLPVPVFSQASVNQAQGSRHP